MDDTRWLRWLKSVTHEDSIRGIARAAGVSHTQVQRWVAKGVPPQRVWDLTLQFKADPIEALIVLGRVPADQVASLNFSAIMSHAPEDALTAELHRRAVERKAMRGELGRSDKLVRQSFHLTAKR